VAADDARGVPAKAYTKGDLGTLVMAFSEKVAPGEVLFERNVFPSRPTMMRMTYQNAAGKKKLHKTHFQTFSIGSTPTSP
jgi:hypothetical protein